MILRDAGEPDMAASLYDSGAEEPYDVPAPVLEALLKIGERSPWWEVKAWQHVANEWADMATSGIQWLRNIQDGTSSVEDALRNMADCLNHCEAVRDTARNYAGEES